MFAYSYTISVEDVYKTSTPTIPENYEVVAFRPPKVDELFLGDHNNGAPICASTAYIPSLPRLILKSKIRKFLFERIQPPAKYINADTYVYFEGDWYKLIGEDK